jgi:hypothetical protein
MAVDPFRDRWRIASMGRWGHLVRHFLHASRVMSPPTDVYTRREEGAFDGERRHLNGRSRGMWRGTNLKLDKEIGEPASWCIAIACSSTSVHCADLLHRRRNRDRNQGATALIQTMAHDVRR